MFDQELTADLKAVCNDEHLTIKVDPELVYRVRDISKNGWTIDSEDNFGVKEVKILKGNVGYINLTGFFDVKDAGDTIASAMELLSIAKESAHTSFA